MKTIFKKLNCLSMICILLFTTEACKPGPELHLHDGMAVTIELPIYAYTIDELWQYNLDYMTGYPTIYNWKDEWVYGWDDTDIRNNGPIGYKTLRQYQIRRYYQGSDPDAKHNWVRSDYCLTNTFSSTYNFGYYDILLWNEPDPIDGVESNHFDESSLDSVNCYTNPSMTTSRYDLSTSIYAYYPPDELFSAYHRGLFISRNPADYDRYDEEREVYYKSIDFLLEPRTYIYLAQLILINNEGRATSTGGGMISGMARTTNVNTGLTGSEPVSVTFDTRMKNNILYKNGKTVDVIGGRLVSFGICNIYPNMMVRPIEVPGYASAIASGRYGKRVGVSTSSNTARSSFTRHYLDVNIVFYNGCDSTYSFDITDKVMERFRGGVVTFEVDMDTIQIPTRGGGTGFNAGVEDYQDGGTHEIEL